MNYRMILRLVCSTLRIVAVLMAPALLVSLGYNEMSAALSFGVTIGLMLLLSLTGRFLKPVKTTLYAREGFVLVAVAWIILSMLGALPFLISGAIPNYVDCLFETVSGFTTTGASILSDVESLPRGIIYWRSFTHWLGGMGVLVFMLAISSFAGRSGDGMFIMRAESPGPQVSKLVPRTAQTARILYSLYIALTCIQVVFLLAGGMPLFDAVTTAFGTAGTGGFGIRNDSMMSYSPYLQNVVTVFMLLFGVNFGIYYLLIRRSFREALREEELRMYLIMILAATGVITAATLRFYTGGHALADALRHAAFQVVSITTTTGFCSIDYESWPQICHTVLLTLMIVGACAGSTGGGTKCSRVIILLRSLKVEIQKLLHPGMVRPVTLNKKTVPEETVRGVYAFYGMYALIAVGSLLLVSLDGFDLETNLSAMLSCLNNIGPGFRLVGPTGNFGSFSPLVKLVLILDMLIGRLEIFPIVLLCLPQVWRRDHTIRRAL